VSIINKRRLHWLGKRVKTHPVPNRPGYTAVANAERREGTGFVVKHSDSHGLCFEVNHEDGRGTAWYEASELKELEPNGLCDGSGMFDLGKMGDTQ